MTHKQKRNLLGAIVVFVHFLNTDASEPSITAWPGFELERTTQPRFYLDRVTWTEKICPAGFFCNGDGFRYACRNANTYCPFNSSEPTTVFPGYRTVKENVTLDLESPLLEIMPQTEIVRVIQSICEPGYFCERGVASPCRVGTYSNTTGLDTERGCLACDAGYYCEKASTSPQQFECGSPNVYCPTGSSHPISVNTNVVGALTWGPSYYTSSSSTTEQLSLTTCHANEPKCQLQSDIATNRSPFDDPASISGKSWYLTTPSIIENDSTRTERHICEAGFYCIEGDRFECPPGRFGETVGLSTALCSGQCESGYFCPAGSTSARQHRCGNVNKYCPPGSGSATSVDVGYYSSWTATLLLELELNHPNAKMAALPSQYWRIAERYFHTSSDDMSDQVRLLPDPQQLLMYGPTADEAALGELWLGPPAHDPELRAYQHMCEPGHYCVDGYKYPCAPGTFGGTIGLFHHSCSGACHAGFFCPLASTVAREIECGDVGVYCPGGDGASTPVDEGQYTVGTGFTSGHEHEHQQVPAVTSNSTAVGEMTCEPGHFCTGGIKRQCPAGTYGASSGLSSANCDGPCESGFFCPPGSTFKQQLACGEAFAYSDTINTFHEQSADAPGFDPTCVTHQLPGVGTTLVQFFEFSLLPSHVAVMDTTRWDLSHNTQGGVVNSMKWETDELALRADGTGTKSFMGTKWRPGSGAKTFCMWKKFTTDNVYGMDGLSRVKGLNDHFALGTFWSYTNRVYAAVGEHPGTYGNETVHIAKGEWVFYCLASEGNGGGSRAYVATRSHAFVGPELVWTQENNGNDLGTLPHANSFGMVYGAMGPSFVTGRPNIHTRQAYSSALYGGIIHWNEFLSQDDLVHVYRVLAKFYPGHGGRRDPNMIRCGQHRTNEWEQGFNGRHQGVQGGERLERDDNTHEWTRERTAPTDDRQIGVGPGSFPWDGNKQQPRAPRVRVSLGVFDDPDNADGESWKDQDKSASAGQTVGALPVSLEGGPFVVFCPEGSALPSVVRPGYYTVTAPTGTGGRFDFDVSRRFGDLPMSVAEYMTQGSEQECEPGWYCQSGRRLKCPAGRSGNTRAETRVGCSGACPPGHFCPLGTAEPLECEAGMFAGPGATRCVSCPGGSPGLKQVEETRCRTNRRCCFV